MALIWKKWNSSIALIAWCLVICMPAFHTCKKFPDDFFHIQIDTLFLYSETLSSYRFEGTVVGQGELDVEEHGFCWSVTDPPDVSDEKETHYYLFSDGSFYDIVYDLDDTTTYYVRAYAETNEGTKYSTTKVLTTSGPPSAPVLKTYATTDIAMNSARGGGEITYDGSSEILDRGICYSISPTPAITDFCIREGSGTGSFTTSLSGLKTNTTYFVRAYATNEYGTGYGEVRYFRTLSSGPVITDYDGNQYNTVQIGDQLWMAENLKAFHYPDGTPIPLVEENNSWRLLGEKGQAYCWYEGDETNSIIYGFLYNWHAASKGSKSSEAIPSGMQGVCPQGWHLPSSGEWKQLEMHLGMNPVDADKIYGRRGTDEGGKLKESGLDYWESPNEGATNESGFTALAAGARDQDGDYLDLAYSSFYWTSTSFDEDHYLVRALRYDSSYVFNIALDHNVALSVRCVKNNGSASLPSVITTIVTNISDNTAQTGGEVTSNGGAEVTAYGVCWSESELPTLSDSYTTDGSGTGSYISSLTGLNCNTTYYIRAYATNSAGTAFGPQYEFTTLECPASKPSVSTTTISGITANSAQGGANVTDDGGSAILSRGVCWSQSKIPTLADEMTENGSGTGIFTSEITGLNPGTLYYVRAYASNAIDTAYGNQVSFTTTLTDTTVTDYDGNTYQTIPIGDQVWMAENLKVTRYADGTPLVDGTAAGAITGDRTTKYYFAHDNNESRVEEYGRLYTWAAVMDGAGGSDGLPSGIQGVCPDGWHIPSDAEWQVLEKSLGMSVSDAANWNWRGTNQGTQMKEGGDSGFKALLGGYRDHNGFSYELGNFGYFWSSTDDGSNGYYRQLGATSSQVRRVGTDKSNAHSIRCVKD